MPFPMKIQPIDTQQGFREQSKPPVLKSRLKRLFDRPFNGVLKISSTAGGDKPAAVSGEAAAAVEFEPSSVCLDKMVQNFIEENAYDNKAPAPAPAAQKFCRHRCNCFNGNSNDSSDDEFDFGFGDSVNHNNSSFGDSLDSLKSLIPCSTTVERNLLADTSKIVEKNKNWKRKVDLRKFVTDGLLALGFNASICKSKWEKSLSIPSGEYEYIDVIMEGERVLIDVDFRSEFEIARSTSSYKAILQSLPFIFVGNADRLQQIIDIVSEAARASLKKKGMHIAPWRKTEYVRAKWLSPFVRTTTIASIPMPPQDAALSGQEPGGGGGGDVVGAQKEAEMVEAKVDEDVLEGSECGELELIFGEKDGSQESSTCASIDRSGMKVGLNNMINNKSSIDASINRSGIKFGLSDVNINESKPLLSSSVRFSGGEASGSPVMVPWQPPVVRLKSCERGNRAIVTGLASLLKEKP